MNQCEFKGQGEKYTSQTISQSSHPPQTSKTYDLLQCVLLKFKTESQVKRHRMELDIKFGGLGRQKRGVTFRSKGFEIADDSGDLLYFASLDSNSDIIDFAGKDGDVVMIKDKFNMWIIVFCTSETQRAYIRMRIGRSMGLTSDSGLPSGSPLSSTPTPDGVGINDVQEPNTSLIRRPDDVNANPRPTNHDQVIPPPIGTGNQLVPTPRGQESMELDGSRGSLPGDVSMDSVNGNNNGE